MIRLSNVDGDKNIVGYRIPGVWVFQSNGEYFIHLCMAIRGNANFCVNIKIYTNTWHSLVLSQEINSEGQFVVRAYLDGVSKLQETNKNAEVFQNVKVFGSDSFYTTFDGLIRNLKICTTGN